MTWPPPYSASTASAGREGYPPRGWPSRSSLTYTKELITVVLLVLALPWLVWTLLTRPARVLGGIGRSAASPVK